MLDERTEAREMKGAEMVRNGWARAGELLRDTQAQGTTEYAILVGVLAVIAIVAIIAFRGKVQELWDAIANGINSL